MITGRQLRLGLCAALLAVLFVFVTVGHHDAHGTPADPPCAMCHAASDGLAAAAPASPVFRAITLLGSSVEAPIRLDVPPQPPSRGPPSLG